MGAYVGLWEFGLKEETCELALSEAFQVLGRQDYQSKDLEKVGHTYLDTAHTDEGVIGVHAAWEHVD